MSSSNVIEHIAKALDLVGVVTVAAALVYAVASALLAGPAADRYRLLRRRFGRGILLGLEVLVAADIIRTVAIRPDLYGVAVLAAIVLVRTFLSLSLEVEISGRWPWRADRERVPQ